MKKAASAEMIIKEFLFAKISGVDPDPVDPELITLLDPDPPYLSKIKKMSGQEMKFNLLSRIRK
jgi:hypothetical protein